MTSTSHAIAVVLLTTCRASMVRAVRSVYLQQFDGDPQHIHLLIGVDCDPHRQLDELMAILAPERPPHVTISIINPGYSTSRRHGGVHTSHYGGSLRSVLTLLADSEIVTYLDDDDWFKENHCARILHAIEGKKWAYTYSIYADGNTAQELCVDEIESVGVGRGIYAQKFGGFVRPTGLAINKMELLHLVHLWSCSPFASGDGEDRLVFDKLRTEPYGCTDVATVCCSLDPKDGNHELRMQFIRSRGIDYQVGVKVDSTR